MIDELREIHLGIPRPDPNAPLASELMRAAYEEALSHQANTKTRSRSSTTRPRKKAPA